MLPESADLHVADSRNRPQLGGPTEPRKRLGFGRSVRQLTGPDNERIAAAVEPKSPAVADAVTPLSTAADMQNIAPQNALTDHCLLISSGAGSAGSMSTQETELTEAPLAAPGASQLAQRSGGAAMTNLVAAEQIPAEFIHLYTSIESHILDKERPSELA